MIHSIQRRHFEQIKVVVPVVLNALKAVDFGTSDGDVKCDTLYGRAMDIASSIQSVCGKLVCCVVLMSYSYFSQGFA